MILIDLKMAYRRYKKKMYTRKRRESLQEKLNYRERGKIYYHKNKEWIKEKNKTNPTYKEKRKITCAKHRATDGFWIKRKEYQKLKYKTDPQFRMSWVLRSRLLGALESQLAGRRVSALSDLGCSVPEFIKHIEAQWEPWMNWDNYGNKPESWSLDHIKPFAAFDLSDPQQQKEVVHFTNIRPLRHLDNIKKSDSFDNTAQEVVR